MKPKNSESGTINTTHKSVKRFTLGGNGLYIDFANTVYDPYDPAGALLSWDDLTGFLGAVGAIDQPEMVRLRSLGIRESYACDKAFADALELRTSLRKILAAIEANERILTDWVKPINVVLQANEGYEQLAPVRARWNLVYVPQREEPLRALVGVAHSAAKLIEEGQGAPVRKCANPNCVLYFYDVSRTHLRRWCSMKVCGNRMKVAAYGRRYQKRKRARK
jgi:predicted RNA-binding Zn ribbon-like protein